MSDETAVKSPHAGKNNDFITLEKKINERVVHSSRHPSLPHYYGPHEEFHIRLECAPPSQLQSFLLNYAGISTSQRLRWTVQITEAPSFLHAVGVFHGHLICNTILLDADINAKLVDFSGSSLDGSPLLVSVTTSHACSGEMKITQSGYISKYLMGEFQDTKPLREVENLITKC
ncbi:hypothetical protein J1614_010814 [Plenodomus biglobosus]|nr:hypothetical protein J1614_010814 [Plenodomus biglobosus]